MVLAPVARTRGRLAVMSVGHAVDDLYQGAVPALLTFLVAERHYSYAAATGVTFAATFLSSVVQPGFGVLTDRRRLRWLVPAGMAMAGIGIGLSGVGHAYGWTWATVALSGVGVAAYHPEASRAARGLAGGSAGAMSWFALGGNVGFALGPLVVTPVLTATGLAGTPLLAVPALVGAVALAVVLRRRPGHAGPAATPQASPAHDDWHAFGWLTAVVIGRSITFFGVSSLLALYVTQRFGLGHAAGNAALAVLFAAGVVGTLLGGRLADRRGRVRAIRVGYLLALPGVVLLVLAPDPAVGYLAAAVLGLALYLPFSVHVTLGQEYLPNRVGTASGITLGLAVSVGGVLAPVWGALADAAGLRTALAAMIAFPVASLLLSTRLREPQRR